MKKVASGCFIAFGILAQLSTPFQSSPRGENATALHIVVLKQASVVEKILEWVPQEFVEFRQSSLRTPSARRYHDLILSGQSQLIDSLESQRIQVLERRSFLVNMLLVKGSEQEMQQLGRREEVRGVYPNKRRFLLMDTAPTVVGAPSLWAVVGGIDNAGRGVRIGIIDSGINPEHPMFNDDGLAPPLGFPPIDLELVNQDFVNNKVIVARNYVKPEFEMNPQENQTAEDELGHGSGVAAIAAGRQVMAPLAQIQGIAPLAFLGNYKVFGTPGINGTTTSAAIIAAINDGVKDGMDVLNLSLGGTAVDPATDPEQMTIANAVALGVVVVIAAGNAGPGPNTISSPGTSPAAVSGGASLNGRIFEGSLEIDSSFPLPPELERIPSTPGEGVMIDDPLGPYPIVSIAQQDPTELACQELFPGSLLDRVALVQRGECFFTEKATHVFDAGAEAMVVYNNVDGPAITMAISQAGEEFVLPAVMIEKSPGEALGDFLVEGKLALVTLHPSGPVPSPADEVSLFSSQGPNIDLGIKPDLTAPGQEIYTASKRAIPEPDYTLVNGTSFSTPIVSGAAALIKQLHPNWSAEAIKSALVNTAAKTTTWNGNPARVLRTGNGRLDLAQVLNASAMLDPVSVSFGFLDVDASVQIDRPIELTHLGGGSQTYQIELVEAFKNPSVHLSISPSSVTLGEGQKEELILSAQFASPLTGGTFEGQIRVTSAPASELTAPFWGGVSIQDSTVLLQVSKTPGSEFSDLSSAIQAARPGNVIEIADSSTYAGSLEIFYNSEGLPLDGLTLRSAPGQSPTIEATGAGSLAAISVVDRKQVTLEGLRIQGGAPAIRFRNASGVIRANTIGDPLAESGSHGIHLTSSSRAHIFGNTIQSHARSGIVLSDSAALIQQNQVNENEENGNFRLDHKYSCSL